MNEYVNDNKNSLSAKAWKDFINKLDSAGNIILGELGATDERERAEGFRFLTRLLSIGLDLHLEHDDADYPTFTRMISDTRKYIGDNPDAEYDYATLSGNNEYVITGKRGVSNYLAFCLYGENEDGSATHVGANICDVDLTCDSDGNYELYLSKEKKPHYQNWLEMDDNTSSMIVRQYFVDDNRAGAGTYAIKNLNKVAPKAQFTEAMLTEKLSRVGEFVNDIANSSSALSIFSALNTVSVEKLEQGEKYQSLEIVGAQMDAKGRPSAEELAQKIDPSSIAKHMPTPDIQYSGAWWEAKESEAIIIEGKNIPCRYWSLQIFNRWMESPDYRYNKLVDINNTEVEYEDDGSFQVVLCAKNHGFKNWINTDGYTSGQICFRALLAEEQADIAYRAVKVKDLVG